RFGCFGRSSGGGLAAGCMAAGESIAHERTKMQMTEDAQRLDRIGSRHPLIFYHHQIIAVALLAAWRKIRRPSEHLPAWQIEIGDNEFVVLVNAGPSRPFSLEWHRRDFGKIVEINDAERPVWFFHRQPSELVGNAVAEHVLVHQPIDSLARRT